MSPLLQTVKYIYVPWQQKITGRAEKSKIPLVRGGYQGDFEGVKSLTST